MHLTRQQSNYAPPYIVDEQLTTYPILLGGEHSQLALRWCEVQTSHAQRESRWKRKG